MPSKTNSRNHRNNPYMFDGMAVRVQHSAAGVVWRWRTEIILFVLTLLASLYLLRVVGGTWTLVILFVVAAAVAVIPWTRRFIVRHAWCVITRHRLQRLFFEVRPLHTLSGRMPLILWIRPTEVGEKAYILCRAGICAEDFQAHTGELSAACMAREARVDNNPRWTQLVKVVIIRRDSLASRSVIKPNLAPRSGAKASALAGSNGVLATSKGSSVPACTCRIHGQEQAGKN